MSIQRTSGQICVSGGTISINGSAYIDATIYLQNLYGYNQRHNEVYRYREYRKIETFNYYPFAIITTDNDTFMTIEALSHDDNVYPTGKKIFQYNKKQLADWRSAFEYMKPYKGRWGITWKNPSPKIYDYKQLIQNKGAKQCLMTK